MKISFSLFGKRCSPTPSGRHASTEKDRALWVFSPGSQRTNMSLQTGLRSNGGSFPENHDFPRPRDKLGLKGNEPTLHPWYQFSFQRGLLFYKGPKELALKTP